MNTIKINKGNCKMIAHRGLSGIEPENTAAAFVAAGNRSFFAIETDVRRTIDGRYVLNHDDTTARCGIDVITPEKSTFETIQSIRLMDMDGKRGRNDLRIPELRDYLSICKRYEKVAVLEFKTVFTEEEMAEVVEIIKAEHDLEKMIFISFQFDALVNLRKVYPEAKCQFLTIRCDDELFEKLKEHKFDIDATIHAFPDKETIDKFHQAGMEVNIWTLDDPEKAEKYISWGADYITTNILE